jgi:hypothetical protein
VAGLLSLRTWLCGPLLGVWADVGASPGDGEDQSFVAEDLDRSQDRVTAYVVLLLELLHGWQGALRHSPLAILVRRMAASC